MRALGLLAMLVVTQRLWAATPYETIQTDLKSLQARYPAYASVFSLGNNEDGVPIQAIRISTTPGSSDPRKIAHLVVATHHGNERAAPVLAMHLAKTLLLRYESMMLPPGRLTDTEWVIIPVLNVPGYNRGIREERNTDSNRDYPGPCSSAAPTLKSIQALIAHFQTRVYTSTVTIHGYWGALVYPWGFSTSRPDTLDDGLYESITRKATTLNNYVPGNSGKVIYPALGTFEDWSYWKYGTWSWLVELADGGVNDIIQTTDSLLWLLENINASPSTSNQHMGRCYTSYALDLHNE